MLTNFHTHSTYCDGKSTLEEIVLFAVDRGFSALGFSGHGYTDFDLSYCMKDTEGYINEINHLKEKYKGTLKIYLGIEEDARYILPRERFDYIIGSSHYLPCFGKYLPIDESPEMLRDILSGFGGDIIKTADCYYSFFCDYIMKRKPDIIGHFDLITKYEEISPLGFFESREYTELSLKYTRIALKSGSLFEVNTGAMSRGARKTPYPSPEMLHLIKKGGGRLILSSDCHDAKHLDFAFDKTRLMLKDIGFECVYALDGKELIKDNL